MAKLGAMWKFACRVKGEDMKGAVAVPVAITSSMPPTALQSSRLTWIWIAPMGAAVSDRVSGRGGAARLTISTSKLNGSRITISMRPAGSAALMAWPGRGPERKSGPFTVGWSVSSMVRPNRCRSSPVGMVTAVAPAVTLAVCFTDWSGGVIRQSRAIRFGPLSPGRSNTTTSIGRSPTCCAWQASSFACCSAICWRITPRSWIARQRSTPARPGTSPSFTCSCACSAARASAMG